MGRKRQLANFFFFISWNLPPFIRTKDASNSCIHSSFACFNTYLDLSHITIFTLTYDSGAIHNKLVLNAQVCYFESNTNLKMTQHTSLVGRKLMGSNLPLGWQIYSCAHGWVDSLKSAIIYVDCFAFKNKKERLHQYPVYICVHLKPSICQLEDLWEIRPSQRFRVS